MIALLFLFAFLLIGVCAACSRRALPLACGAALAWAVHAAFGDWLATMAAGSAAAVVVALILDWLSEKHVVRPVVIAAETLAACAFGVVGAFAVFGSSGVRGVALLTTMLAAGLLAAVTALRARVHL